MNILGKLRNFVYLDDGEEYDEQYYEEEIDDENYEQEIAEKSQYRRANREKNISTTEAGEGKVRNNVIGMPVVNNGISEVVVFEPHSFEEMPQVIQALRQRRSVVLNLNVMDPDEAQRAVDFVAGGTYAIDGHQERIGESIFLFTPSCVQVSTQSGVVHEVHNHVSSSSRSATPTPTWSETNRIAQ